MLKFSTRQWARSILRTMQINDCNTLSAPFLQLPIISSIPLRFHFFNKAHNHIFQTAKAQRYMQELYWLIARAWEAKDFTLHTADIQCSCGAQQEYSLSHCSVCLFQFEFQQQNQLPKEFVLHYIPTLRGIVRLQVQLFLARK